jgi:AraC family transcriptional regulator
MGQPRFADTTLHIGRLQRVLSPPIIPEVFLGDTRLVGRWRNEPFEYDLPPLKHHVLSAKYAGEGLSSLKIGRRIICAPSMAGTFTLAPRGHSGVWRAEGAVEVSNIFLGHERLLACADQVGNGRAPELLDRVNFSDPRMVTIMTWINEEVSSGGAPSHLYIEQLLDLVCLQLIKAHSGTTMPVVLGTRGLAAWQVKRVADYMRDNLAKNIKLQELADVVSLSRFHFCTAFRIATGHTPHAWLTRQRIAYAKRLLQDPTLRITDIALVIGYETPSSFSANFRKVAGLTPSEFRRRL